MTHTKIICTIGPSVGDYASLLALMRAGMNVARLNFSHGSRQSHGEVIELLKRARNELQQPLTILLDTKGAEIRVGKVPRAGIRVVPGQRLRLTRDHVEGSEELLTITPAVVFDALKPGTHLLIDNGYISSHVVEVGDGTAVIEIDNPGEIHSSKGVNIPDAHIPLPTLTANDMQDIQCGLDHGIDAIAISFVQSPDVIVQIREMLHNAKHPEVLLLAKIESHEGVEQFDSILQAADGIMIARGDLGVEVPLSHVPQLQKTMIRKCYLMGKPAVTATQMLESMISNPRPTRAEVSDVANAIYDSTSAVMLSGETAVGKYPLETVTIMRSIIQETERHFDYKAHFDQHTALMYHDVPSAITLAAVKTASSLGVKAIIAFTRTGLTARLLSRLRPNMPIIALTPNETTYHQLAINWGVTPLLCKEGTTFDKGCAAARAFAMEQGVLTSGDLIVAVMGTPMWSPGATNSIVVQRVA